MSVKWIHIAAAAVLAVLLVTLFSCKNTESNESDQEGMAMKKGPGKFMTDFKESDKFFTLMDGMKEGKSPHGKTQIWYSSNVKGMLGKSSFEVPEGTVAIKPFDKDDEEGLDGIAVMIKKEEGYDPDNNDWYYAMYTAKGEIMEKPEPGKVKMCIDCHASASAKDYLAGTEMR